MPQVNFKYGVGDRVVSSKNNNRSRGIIFQCCFDGENKYYKFIEVEPYWSDVEHKIHTADENQVNLIKGADNNAK